MKYSLEFLKKYGMNNSKTILTPMTSNVLIDKDEKEVEITITKYRGIIEFLFY